MLQEIGFALYVDSLNSKASALSSLVEGLDTGPHGVTKSCCSVPGLGSSLA